MKYKKLLHTPCPWLAAAYCWSERGITSEILVEIIPAITRGLQLPRSLAQVTRLPWYTRLYCEHRRRLYLSHHQQAGAVIKYCILCPSTPYTVRCTLCDDRAHTHTIQYNTMQHNTMESRKVITTEIKLFLIFKNLTV